MLEKPFPGRTNSTFPDYLMKRFALLLFLPLLLAGSFVAVNEACLSEAQAARFGGGRSFGGKPAFQRSAPAQAPTKQPGAPTQSAAAQSGAAQSQARGGLGGLFGPLLAGSLLGALIFGGAFQGIGGMDIVVILLGVFLLTRLLRGRRTAQQAAGRTRQSAVSGQETATRGGDGDKPAFNPLRGRPAGADSADPWARLRSNQGAGNGENYQNRSGRDYSRGGADRQSGMNAAQPADSVATAESRPGLRLPADFDLNDFMAGAKAIYIRLQESWDSRDLEDIKQFTTPAVAEEIRRQAQDDPGPSQTDILLINAELTDFKQGGGVDEAAVYFDVLLREGAGRPNTRTREIWHFTRRRDETWKLDGIQQTE